MTTVSRYYLAFTLGIAFVVCLYLLGLGQTQPVYGSVAIANDYFSTTTAASTAYGSTVTSGRLLKAGYGALGSVVITGANTGVINIYDATTTNVNLRTNQAATSTLLLVSIPASLVAGTYTYDLNINNGIYVDLVSGSMPTSTITYR